MTNIRIPLPEGAKTDGISVGCAAVKADKFKTLEVLVSALGLSTRVKFEGLFWTCHNDEIVDPIGFIRPHPDLRGMFQLLLPIDQLFKK